MCRRPVSTGSASPCGIMGNRRFFIRHLCFSRKCCSDCGGEVVTEPFPRTQASLQGRGSWRGRARQGKVYQGAVSTKGAAPKSVKFIRSSPSVWSPPFVPCHP
jgi:hypothetical protein